MKKENYFMPKTDPLFENLMKRHKPLFEKCKANNLKKLSLSVAPEVIEKKQTVMINEILLMAEHNREWIELILFTIYFKIQQIKDSKLYYGVEDYVTNKEIGIWLRKLGESLPFTLFFLGEWEARFATIAGDIIINKKPELITEEGRGMFNISKEDQNQINKRLGQACTLFMHYCHGTGFDPKQAIEAMLAEFNAVFDYAKVEEVFKKELKKGMKPRVKQV
jgi:hypothetical protein